MKNLTQITNYKLLDLNTITEISCWCEVYVKSNPYAGRRNNEVKEKTFHLYVETSNGNHCSFESINDVRMVYKVLKEKYPQIKELKPFIKYTGDYYSQYLNEVKWEVESIPKITFGVHIGVDEEMKSE